MKSPATGLKTIAIVEALKGAVVLLAAAGAGASVTEGFSAGLTAVACLMSAAFGAAFGVAASGRGDGSLRLASTTFGLAGAGALAVVSALPSPTLRARLENHPSDFSPDVATRVVGAGAAAA